MRQGWIALHKVPGNEASATPETAPETAYKNTSDPRARRRIQGEIVVKYRGRLASYVRRHLSARHWQEAEQVGAIGLLVALEKFEPSRGVPFWFFAVQWVRKEIQRWLNHGVYWRPHTNGAKGRQTHDEHRAHGEFQDEAHVSETENVEDLVSTAEGLSRVGQFLDTLSVEERHLLICEKRDRGNPNSDRVRRYLSLVGRATAFVRGNEDGHRESV